jgi:hypothetical protein
MSQRSIGFVSFAGGHLRWRFAKVRLNQQIKQSGYFRSAEIYSEEKLNLLVSRQVRELIADNRLGHGLWIWKPVVVMDFLEKNPTCDSILYLDAGCDFNSSDSSKRKWGEYVSDLDEYDSIIFQNDHAEEKYTSKKLVKRLSADIKDIKSGQIEAGAFFMNRIFAQKFCREWFEIMLEDDFGFLKNDKGSNSTDFYECHIDYRYDQSIFSLMMKQQQGVKILQADQETDFAPYWNEGWKYPILRSRNRSIVPVLRTGLIARVIRRIERRVIRTYNSVNSYKEKTR